MSAVQPYDAWFFIGVDNIDEVNATYAKFGTDDEGWQRWPSRDEDLVDRVRVIAVEEGRRGDDVWFIRNGLAERWPSWMVRTADIDKEVDAVSGDGVARVRVS